MNVRRARRPGAHGRGHSTQSGITRGGRYDNPAPWTGGPGATRCRRSATQRHQKLAFGHRMLAFGHRMLAFANPAPPDAGLQQLGATECGRAHALLVNQREMDITILDLRYAKEEKGGVVVEGSCYACHQKHCHVNPVCNLTCT